MTEEEVMPGMTGGGNRPGGGPPPSGRFLRASAQHGLPGLFNVRRVLHGEKDVGDGSGGLRVLEKSGRGLLRAGHRHSPPALWEGAGEKRRHPDWLGGGVRCGRVPTRVMATMPAFWPKAVLGRALNTAAVVDPRASAKMAPEVSRSVAGRRTMAP